MIGYNSSMSCVVFESPYWSLSSEGKNLLIELNVIVENIKVYPRGSMDWIVHPMPGYVHVHAFDPWYYTLANQDPIM
jgi:hypothetical protein